MVVILDHDENILEFMDDADASIEITDTYGGYKSLDFDCELTNVKQDQYLFKQGNKLFIENTLFVINTEVEVDYVDNLIHLEAEELVYELNNCEPFYINDPMFKQYVSGKTIRISVNMLNLLFNGFYTVDTTDLTEITPDKKLVTVPGTITKYKLLKEIETATGLMFKYHYALEKNKIIKKVNLVLPEHYGVTHNKLLERVTVGENTKKLEYSSDETKNALGIMPIIKSEDNSNVDYTKILKQFYDLDINNEKVMPYYSNYSALVEDVFAAAKTLHEKITTFGHIPDTVDMLFDDDEILHIGMSQFVDMATKYMINPDSELIYLSVVEPPEITTGDTLNCVFEDTDINNLAYTVQDYISKTGCVNTTISTKYGRVSFQWLIYILAEFLTTKKKVVCKSEEYPYLNKIIPSKVEYNVKYVVDSKDYEYMPFMYTQNTSDSNNIPYRTPINPPAGANYYDVDKYISESYPEMVLTKQANAEEIIVTITKKNISQDTAESFFIGFKEVTLIQDNSDITIDFSKKEIKFMKFFEWIEEKQVEVTETVENDDVITANYYPTCECCGGSVEYKRYTKTFQNYCPECGSHGTLGIIPKSVDGEITCLMSRGGCDSDYCCYCGGEKDYGKCGSFRLTPADATTEQTRTETIQEVHQEYKEVIASNENTGEDETKIRLNGILTENSKIDVLHGDISIKITGATLKSLKCDSTKLYEMSEFPYMKRKKDMFIYAPVALADFNYTHMTNNNPKLEPFETSEQSIEEVLIGCWKKLNGSGDNTAWLEKAEDIDVDLTEENLDLNAGDFVYIKLPDTTVFKAQITEKKYDPKIKSDSKLKIGNVSREAIT